MDRHFDDPKHLRIKERKLFIRVATDAADADTITVFANSEDRANDVNRLQERTARSALIPKQEVFDQNALDDLWSWAKAEGMRRAHKLERILNQ